MFSLTEGLTEKEKKEVIKAVVDNMQTLEHFFPTSMSASEYEDFKRAEKEHAPNVAVRIVNFKPQYYNTITGEIVS